jgi:hypothetical protein
LEERAVSALKKTAGEKRSASRGKRVVPRAKDLTPRPCGEVDYEALAEDVSRRFPNILARLAE